MRVRLAVYKLDSGQQRFMRRYHHAYRTLCEAYGSDRICYGEDADRNLVIWMDFETEEEAALYKLTYL